MGESHLPLTKLVASLFQKRGFRSSSRFCYSSSSSVGGTSKQETLKQIPKEDTKIVPDQCEAKKNTETKPTVLPKEDVREGTNLSWHNMKGIFGILKDKMLGRSQDKKGITSELSCTVVDSTPSEVNMRPTSSDIAGSDVSFYSIYRSHVAKDSLKRKNGTASCGTSPSNEDVGMICQYPGYTELCKPETFKETPKVVLYKEMDVAQLAEPSGVCHTDENEKSTLITAISYSSEEYCSKERAQAGDSDYLVNVENGLKLPMESRLDILSGTDRNKQIYEDSNGEALGTMQDENFMPTSLGIGEYQLEESKAYDSSKVIEAASSCKISEKTEHLLNKYTSMKNLSQTAGEDAGPNVDLLFSPAKVSQATNGDSANSSMRIHEVESLVDKIMSLSRKKSAAESQDASTDNVVHLVKKKSTMNNVQPFDESNNADSGCGVSLLESYSKCKKDAKVKEKKEKNITEDKNSTVLVAATGCLESESRPHLSQTTETNQTPVTCLTGEHTENKLSLRFVHKDITQADIQVALETLGPILKIQGSSFIKESPYRDFFIHFEKRESLKNALKATDFLLKKSRPFWETDSSADMPKEISIPSLIGDPDVPISLVRQPTRTIKIMELSSQLSLPQLKKALSFCGSGITRFFWGSSDSVAYVEFETEDAKERALVKHTIQVQQKQVAIERIDVPRTTVVRVKHFNQECSLSMISKICADYGKLVRVIPRCEGVVDVDFKVTEWPYMLSILNSLNGLKVGGSQWIAQPAPVFPPLILKALWDHPEERRHVIAVMQALAGKVMVSDKTELSYLIDELYGQRRCKT